MSARGGAAESPSGGGVRVTIASRMASTPSPVLADTVRISSCVAPVSSCSSISASGTLLAGRSILFSTGMISRSLSIARYALATVWASTPWVESTSSTAPSQAARLRETS